MRGPIQKNRYGTPPALRIKMAAAGSTLEKKILLVGAISAGKHDEGFANRKTITIFNTSSAFNHEDGSWVSEP
jgi:hypothetical protein